MWVSGQTEIIFIHDINWLVFVTETQCVYCAVRTGYLYIINRLQPSGHYMYRTVVTICTASLTFNNSAFYPHSVFMCFVWIWEQTAIISLYSINWLVLLTETECVYRAIRTGCLHVIQGSDIVYRVLHTLQPNGHYMYRTVVTIWTASLSLINSTFCPHALYLCVLCGSQNKQRLFPYTALTDWFL